MNALFQSCNGCAFSRSMIFGLAAIAWMSGISSAENVVVTEISGSKISGELGTWTESRLTIVGDNAQDIELKNVRSLRIERPPVQSAQPTFAILLSNGDRIFAQSVSADGDRLVIEWPALGSIPTPSIPLERVAAMILDLPITLNERLRLLADIETFQPGSDVVMLGNGDRSQGEFLKLNAAFVELKGPASVLKIDRSRIRAIRMNPELTTTARPNPRRTIITLIDGSRISATEMKLVEDRVKVKSAGLGEMILPLSCIAGCQLFGDRVIPVSDYEPAKVEFTPYLSSVWGLVRNANVLHGPLTLRGTEAVIGLGMHSRMSVTYELRGNEKGFQSLVGIDDAANGAGSAAFTVEVDGRRAWTADRITGKSPVTAIPEIDLQGVKRITLLVDYGQFADVSDYADWCDAVFILKE